MRLRFYMYSEPVQSSFHPTFCKIHVNITCAKTPKTFIPWAFTTCFLCIGLLGAFYTSVNSHTYWLVHPNNISRRLHTVKNIIMQFFHFFCDLIFLKSNYICQHFVFKHLHIIFLQSESILSMSKPNNLFKLMTRVCALFMNSITASQSQIHSSVVKTTSDIGWLKIKDMVLFLWPVSKYEASTIIITSKTILSAEARVRETERERERERRRKRRRREKPSTPSLS